MLTVSGLRELINRAGLKHDDCVEKPELRARAKQAHAQLLLARAAAPPADPDVVEVATDGSFDLDSTTRAAASKPPPPPPPPPPVQRVANMHEEESAEMNRQTEDEMMRQAIFESEKTAREEEQMRGMSPEQKAAFVRNNVLGQARAVQAMQMDKDKRAVELLDNPSDARAAERSRQAAARFEEAKRKHAAAVAVMDSYRATEAAATADAAAANAPRPAAAAASADQAAAISTPGSPPPPPPDKPEPPEPSEPRSSTKSGKKKAAAERKRAAAAAAAAASADTLPGGYAVGDAVFYTGESLTAANGARWAYGAKGEVRGPANEGVAVKFVGNEGNVTCYLATLSRTAPPTTLAGGFAVGETVFYTGDSQTASNGERWVSGARGAIAGPALGEVKDKGVAVRFPSNEGNITCYVGTLSRVDPAAPAPAAPAPAA